MLDPRVHRAALVPLLLAVIVCAFSLDSRPAPLRTTLVPDAFDARQAMALLEDLGDRFPDRRPGGGGDDALATEVAARLRGLGFAVRAERFEGDTIDGRRELVTVIARRAGEPGPGLLVLAHRDAAARGARAELSGTAALLELARVVSAAQLRRSITLVSTSGGSGGAAGARTLPATLRGDPVSAALVLGDLAGERVRKPLVVPWGDGRRAAPQRLTRTVEAAVRTEAGTDPGGARASAQWLRRALPGALGEQGPLVDAGIPAVTLSVSGERPPRAGERVLGRRMERFGRAALRALTALDAGPAVRERPAGDVVTLKKLLPAWSVRLLVAALLLPALLTALDGLARANRRGAHLLDAAEWLARAALPALVALALARLLHLVGLLPAAPESPLPGGAVPSGARELASLGVVALGAALAVVVTRPRRPFCGAGAAVGLGLAVALLATAVWVVSPHAALLLVPAAHLLLLPATRTWAALGRLRRLLVVALALSPVVLAAVVRTGQLGVALDEAPAWLLALVAGGHVRALSWPAWSLLAACVAGACALAWRSAAAPGRQAPSAPVRPAASSPPARARRSAARG